MTSQLAGAVFLGVVRAWRQEANSDFCRERRKFPWSDIDGGHAWFSCLKNSSKLPFLLWHAINSREKREQSLFIEDSCCWAFEIFFLEGVSKKERLFLLIGSSRVFVRCSKRSEMNVSHCFTPRSSICSSLIPLLRLPPPLYLTRSSLCPLLQKGSQGRQVHPRVTWHLCGTLLDNPSQLHDGCLFQV